MSFFQNDTDLLFQKLAAYHLNELDAAEQAEVEAWIRGSEANAKQYQAVQKLLAESEGDAVSIEVDVDKGWQTLTAKMAAIQPASKAKVRSLGWYWAAAAILTGLVIAGWLFFQTGNSNSQWISKTGFDTLRLADGTTIIAKGSATVKFRADFNQGSRAIQLEGSAFFKVHRDTTQPFVIAFNEGKVTVLGTQFYINQQAQGFEVKVTEGKVKAELLEQKGEAILTRGKMVVYNKVTNQFVQQGFAEAAMLKYQNESLGTIVTEIYLAKGIQIHVDKALSDMKLTVDFVNSSPDEIVQALVLLTQGRIQKTGTNKYQLTQE